jgi:hypothetical protein
VLTTSDQIADRVVVCVDLDELIAGGEHLAPQFSLLRRDGASVLPTRAAVRFDASRE